jgi:hypothetical protein
MMLALLHWLALIAFAQPACDAPARRHSRRWRRIDRRNKTISSLRQSLDEARGLGVVAEHNTQAVDCLIQAVIEINVEIVRPQSLSEVVANEDLAGTFPQCEERLKRLVLQFEPYAVLAQLARSGIRFEDAKADRPRTNA